MVAALQHGACERFQWMDNLARQLDRWDFKSEIHPSCQPLAESDWSGWICERNPLYLFIYKSLSWISARIPIITLTDWRKIDPISFGWLFLTDKNRLCIACLLFHISQSDLRVIWNLLFLLSWPLRPYLSDRLGQWNIHWSPAQETMSLELKLNLDMLTCLKMVSGGASLPYGAPKMDTVCVNGTARVAET